MFQSILQRPEETRAAHQAAFKLRRETVNLICENWGEWEFFLPMFPGRKSLVDAASSKAANWAALSEYGVEMTVDYTSPAGAMAAEDASRTWTKEIATARAVLGGKMALSGPVHRLKNSSSMTPARTARFSSPTTLRSR